VASTILFPHAVVITGGPCCGKTTIIESLRDLGYRSLPEVARMVIDESKKKGSDLVPWLRLADFQTEVAKRILEQEQVLEERRDTFFLDRGLIDGAGYCKEGCIPINEEILRHGYNRYGKVIVLDPLPYKSDGSRIETSARARSIHNCIIDVYAHFRYTVYTVPVLPPQERLEIILDIALSE
jgi:predicted ATPase